MSSWKSSNGPTGLDVTEAADDRTLALATPGLNPAKLEAFVQYQTAFLAAAEPEPLAEGVRRLPESPEAAQARLAAAEQQAQSGVPAELRKELARLSAMVADFCGKRWTLQQLEQRRGAHPPAQTEEEQKRLQALDSEILKLREMASFVRRHGAEALALLREHEEALLALHRRLQRLLLQPGSTG